MKVLVIIEKKTKQNDIKNHMSIKRNTQMIVKKIQIVKMKEIVNIKHIIKIKQKEKKNIERLMKKMIFLVVMKIII